MSAGASKPAGLPPSSPVGPAPALGPLPAAALLAAAIYAAGFDEAFFVIVPGRSRLYGESLLRTQIAVDNDSAPSYIGLHAPTSTGWPWGDIRLSLSKNSY